MGIVKNLAVFILLVTSLNDKFVKLIIPAKRKIVRYYSQPAPILMGYETSDDNRTITRKTNDSDGSILAVGTEKQEHVVREARAMTLQPMPETHV